MSRISRLDRSEEVTPDLAVLYDKAFCPARQRAKHVPRHGAPA